MHYSVYLFDADGPLISSVDAALATTNRVLSSFGMQEFSLETWRSTSKTNWHTFYRKCGIPEDRINDAIERYGVYFQEVTHTATRPEEVEETLKVLRTKNIGVVTDMRRAEWDGYYHRFGFDRYIREDAVVTRDDCEERKPSPKPLYLAMEKMGIPRRRIHEHRVRGIMIGDSPVDISAGRAAGLDTAAVYNHGSYNNERLLFEQNPTYMIERISIVTDRRALPLKRIQGNPSILDKKHL